MIYMLNMENLFLGESVPISVQKILFENEKRNKNNKDYKEIERPQTIFQRAEFQSIRLSEDT